MATWATTIEVTDLAAKLGRVTATRTDGEDLRQYVLPSVCVDTHDKPLATIRAEVVAAIHAKFLADQDERDRLAALSATLATWEGAISSDLDALETP